MTLMWHPGTDATFDAPDSAVPIHRQSGWLLASERADHKARIAERETQAKAQDKKSEKGM